MIYRLLLVGALTLFFSACDRLETFEKKYASEYEVRAEGEPGNWIPSSIYLNELLFAKVKFKIDTGARTGLIRYKKEGQYIDDLRCSVIESYELPPSIVVNLDWWPSPLSHGCGESCRVFLCDEVFYVFEGENSSSVYFWSLRSDPE